MNSRDHTSTSEWIAIGCTAVVVLALLASQSHGQCQPTPPPQQVFVMQARRPLLWWRPTTYTLAPLVTQTWTPVTVLRPVTVMQPTTVMQPSWQPVTTTPTPGPGP